MENNLPTCNTRNSRDERVKMHTLIILLGMAPCGIVRIVSELFGSKSISQVYGIVIEYISKIIDKIELEVLVYDDVCHLVAFALNQVLLSRNPTTEFFAGLTFAIDRFHFPNHVDENCHNNFNPSKKPELIGVNTVICEEMFKDINKYTSCKSMSQATFKHFFRYNMDLHNFDIEGMASTITNPHTNFRKESIKIEPVNYDALREEKMESDVNKVSSKLLNLKLLPFNCSLCQCGFEAESQLNKHFRAKHPTTDSSNPRHCPECNKILAYEQSLKRHMLTPITCKVCNEVFNTPAEMILHNKIHYTCNICGSEFPAPSKLKKHMEKCVQH